MKGTLRQRGDNSPCKGRETCKSATLSRHYALVSKGGTEGRGGSSRQELDYEGLRVLKEGVWIFNPERYV